MLEQVAAKRTAACHAAVVKRVGCEENHNVLDRDELSFPCGLDWEPPVGLEWTVYP